MFNSLLKHFTPASTRFTSIFRIVSNKLKNGVEDKIIEFGARLHLYVVKPCIKHSPKEAVLIYKGWKQIACFTNLLGQKVCGVCPLKDQWMCP